jgi:TatD family-associated radical SAM protein
MDTYVYKYGNSIYINLTNRCTNACTFCIRNKHTGLSGDQNLWLKREPDAQEIISELEKETAIEKAVFCGFGEPTMRLEALLEVAGYLKSRGVSVRIDTNGQGSAYAAHDITPRLKGLVDTVSISLNAPDAKGYQKLCRSIYGEDAFGHVLDFAKGCIKQGIETVFSVVDVIDPQLIEESRKVAESAGAKFKVRQYIE